MEDNLLNNNKTKLSLLNDYQLKYRNEILSLNLEEPFEPWKITTEINFEGLFACGWTQSNDIVLVAYGGYEVRTVQGELVYSDYNQLSYDLMSKDNLSFKIRDEKIKIFGLYGGNGNLVSSSGWKLELVYPNWPNGVVLMRRPNKSGETLDFWEGCKLLKVNSLDYTGLKCGFSNDENSFIISGSNGIEVFSKKN